MSNDQDWETVVFRKKQAPAKKKLSSAELNNARLAGQVETVKKCNACRRLEAMRAFDRFPVATKDSQGSNKQRTVAPSRKLDDDDVDAPVTIRSEVRKRISQTRQAKGWTQAELALKISEKATVIKSYESDSKCIPNAQVLSKLEAALGVKLRGTLD